MRKLITLVLAAVSIGFVALPAESTAAESSAATIAANALKQQRRIQEGNRNRNRNRRVRVVISTRIIRIGRHWYRETIKIKYFPNGRIETRVLSRVRIR